MDNQILYWVWLSSLHSMGNVRKRQLLESFNSPYDIWNADKTSLQKTGILTPEALTALEDEAAKNEAVKIVEDAYRFNIGIVSLNDPDYPDYLKNIHDPPIVLYIKGKLDGLHPAIGIVGSRNASTYGRDIAEHFAGALAQCGLTVVSGMARGIDTHAHMGALKGGGKTAAVLGCGLDNVYPSENRKLMEEIEAAGVVMSEYPPGTKPLARHFPARNRIISGLSMGVVIVEAGERSGSLITTDFALEQGREVFSVPGNIDSINSKGTNKLIKEGANMVTCVDDILQELNISVKTGIDYASEIKSEISLEMLRGLDSEERQLARQLSSKPVHIDSLVGKHGASIQKINAVMTMLELKGVAEQLPGRMFRLRKV